MCGDDYCVRVLKDVWDLLVLPTCCDDRQDLESLEEAKNDPSPSESSKRAENGESSEPFLQEYCVHALQDSRPLEPRMREEKIGMFWKQI